MEMNQKLFDECTQQYKQERQKWVPFLPRNCYHIIKIINMFSNLEYTMQSAFFLIFHTLLTMVFIYYGYRYIVNRTD
jgi:hypothetical protein